MKWWEKRLDRALWTFARMWRSVRGDAGGRLIEVGGKPYLTRLFLTPKILPFRVFLHYFHAGDQDRDLHNHPWNWAASLILTGGYVEERRGAPLGAPGKYAVEVNPRRPGTVNVLTSGSFHRADLFLAADGSQRGAWTLFVRGRKIQGWGFWNRYTGEFTTWSENETTDD